MCAGKAVLVVGSFASFNLKSKASARKYLVVPQLQGDLRARLQLAVK